MLGHHGEQILNSIRACQPNMVNQWESILDYRISSILWLFWNYLQIWRGCLVGVGCFGGDVFYDNSLYLSGL